MKTDDRLDSWKEIAAYLRRGVRTAQRWERLAGLPVRRIPSERGAVYAFRSELEAWWRTQSRALAGDQSSVDTPPAIAVLPFATIGDASGDEYIGPGLADEVIRALSEIPNLRVVARNSAFACHAKTRDLPTIGRLLNVARVVRGTVRRSGQKLQITTELVDTSEGRRLWSASREGGAKDVLTLQREVSQAVVCELRASPPQNAVRSTSNAAAYDAYLRARYYASPAAPQGSMRVRAFLSQAIAIDPDFALAHANLAVYFFTLVAMGLLPPPEGMPATRASAQRAIDLDPSIAEAHALAAIVSGLYDHDWVEAGRRFDVALRREPVSPSVRFHYAIWYLSPLRRHTDALVHLELGLADDPLYLLGRVQVAMELHSLGRSEQGFAELDHILKVDPHFGPALGLLGREYAIRGRVQEALALAQQTYAAIPRHPNAVGFLAGMLRRTGDPDRAREVLQSLGAETAWGLARAHAEAHLVCGELESAAESIADVITERDPGVWLLFAGTAGNMIRTTRQWPSLGARMNLPLVGEG